MDFVIEKGNIVNCNTDAIVLPANELLKEGSGTSNAIFSAAGRKKLSEECKRIGKCETGMSVPTPGYKLPAKYIIHAVVPKWIDGEHNEYELLSSAYLSALNVAEKMKCESITFPLLSSGNNGFDRGLALNIAVESINSFNAQYLKDIRLIVYTEEMAVFVKSQGLDVVDSEYDLQREKKQNERKEYFEQILDKGKDIFKEKAIDAIQQAIEAGVDYMKDPENIKKMIAAGKNIANIVLKK